MKPIPRSKITTLMQALKIMKGTYYGTLLEKPKTNLE